jgi:predicted MFS family arabinose efflux permease
MVAAFGTRPGLVITSLISALAAGMLVGVREPVSPVASESALLVDALEGLRYVLRHASLRGLAIAVFLSNLGFGVITVGIPVVVLRHLHQGPAQVGQVFAVAGVAGLVTGVIIGRVRTEGLERWLLAASMAVIAASLALVSTAGTLLVMLLAAAITGAASSVFNVGIFAIRQRRTDPAWFGRAFAVSFGLNVAGEPIGSALSGPLLDRSIPLAFLLGAGITLLAAVLTPVLIPENEELGPRYQTG